MCIRKIIYRCSSPDRQIDRFLDGTISEEERGLFEKRCLEDHAFFLKVQERELLREKVAQTVSAIGSELAGNHVSSSAQRGGLERRVKSLIPGMRIGWAYALLAVALLSLCIILVLPNSDETFAIHPDLEQELGARVLRSAPVQVLSPGVEIKPDDEILFAWEADAQGTFQVVILDNQGNEIKSLRTTGRSIRYQIDLAHGLYYWKLLQNDDWIFTGKILIDKK